MLSLLVSPGNLGNNSATTTCRQAQSRPCPHCINCFLHLTYQITNMSSTALPTIVLVAACLHFCRTAAFEVYGFAVDANDNYRNYDWQVLSTVAWNTDPGLVEAARQHGRKVELNAGNVEEVMQTAEARKAWIQSKIAEAGRLHVNGINFDWEEPAARGSQAARNYARLVQETATMFHEALPGSQVSVDVPWSPYDIDGRFYDWHTLAEAADLLFVMVYDTQSQILGRCIASANSPLDTVSKAVHHWLELGVPANKLVLGLPWYGYDYPCQPDVEGKAPAHNVDVCLLQPVPFRGVACSDAAGAQKCYYAVMEMLRPGTGINTTAVRWDRAQQSPYFNYRHHDGTLHQVWFDNPQSLQMKYQVAVDHGLRGVGFWNLDCLDYRSRDPLVVQQTREMWQAVQEVMTPRRA